MKYSNPGNLRGYRCVQFVYFIVLKSWVSFDLDKPNIWQWIYTSGLKDQSKIGNKIVETMLPYRNPIRWISSDTSIWRLLRLSNFQSLVLADAFAHALSSLYIINKYPTVKLFVLLTGKPVCWLESRVVHSRAR